MFQVSLRVKVVVIDPEKKTIVTKNGKQLNRRNITAANASGSVVIPAWAALADVFVLGTSYDIKSLTIHIYSDVKYTNTNQDTQVQALDQDIGDVARKKFILQSIHA